MCTLIPPNPVSPFWLEAEGADHHPVFRSLWRFTTPEERVPWEIKIRYFFTADA
ncbi:MAG: hypothetical protein KJ064_08690 [Anaerolineae bacterium]|nr:hypothetical protein [Anaerolineae bacterium]